MNAPATISFARRDAAQGAAWLKQAFAMLWAHRVRWLLLLLTYYVVILTIDFIPYLGPFVAPMLKPVFAVGFLAAAWSQERGEAPAIRHLFAGFRANLRALLILGFVFVVGMSAAVIATSLVDDGKLLAVISGRAEIDEAFLSDGNVEAAMLFGVMCALPVLLALWFAPALVVFQDLGAGRALTTSLRAAVGNARPIALYALLVFLYAGVLPGFAAKLIALTLPVETAKTVVVMLVLPYLALLVATLHISDYVSYREVFHPDATPAPSAAPSEGGTE